jgi:hypothetical protein
MELTQCCAARELRWRQSRVGERLADLYVCSACGHIHTMESWLVSLVYPQPGRCVNCGTAGTPKRPSGNAQGSHHARCGGCGLTEDEVRALHDGLAALHPDGDFLQGALVAGELGRNVLAM